MFEDWQDPESEIGTTGLGAVTARHLNQAFSNLIRIYNKNGPYSADQVKNAVYDVQMSELIWYYVKKGYLLAGLDAIYDCFVFSITSSGYNYWKSCTSDSLDFKILKVYVDLIK